MTQGFNVGDLVEIRMLGSNYYGAKGLVVSRIHYQHGHSDDWIVYQSSSLVVSGGSRPAPDEYSCKVKLVSRDETQNEFVMIRAKWLRIISKVEKRNDK